MNISVLTAAKGAAAMPDSGESKRKRRVEENNDFIQRKQKCPECLEPTGRLLKQARKACEEFSESTIFYQTRGQG